MKIKKIFPDFKGLIDVEKFVKKVHGNSWTFLIRQFHTKFRKRPWNTSRKFNAKSLLGSPRGFLPVKSANMAEKDYWKTSGTSAAVGYRSRFKICQMRVFIWRNIGLKSVKWCSSFNRNVTKLWCIKASQMWVFMKPSQNKIVLSLWTITVNQ